MDFERWQKLEAVVQAALDTPLAERAALVREECGDDEDLRREIEKLLDRAEQNESFLESPVWTDSLFLGADAKREIASSLEELGAAPSENLLLGKQVGAYRLTEELGRGGMGVVYLAERADGEFQQKVAVKLIKRGMDTDFILKRFRQERQIAAALNHPNIARLLDGGTTEDGSPYFVMEYVGGAPFFKYVQANELEVRAKLELFVRICRAVAYAHQRRIIHRDIKPGNILVSEDGEPKLLDFGIAKILDPDLIHDSVLPTETQMRLMTPEYASPEQVRGDEITTATDQYSLGVVLYELLTGKRPYKFPSRAPHEIARVICEELPSEPSSGEFGKALIGSGGDFRFSKDFCRRLDRLALKTLRKNPLERYASVKDLADDIERFLRNEPILAESFAREESAEPGISAFSGSSFASTSNQKSVAVLPFRILHAPAAESTTGDGGFLGVGLADALITRISNVRELIVRPTSSILKFGADAADSIEAGRELTVRFVVEGSIVKTEKRVRLSVQLLDVENRSTVWAERFEEDFTDVLAIEDSIAAKVVEFLIPHLSGEQRRQIEKRSTDDFQAYEAYLRGRAAWNTFTEDGLRKAVGFFNRAVELDPRYAAAHAAIADYYVWLGMYSLLPNEDFYPAAKNAARRAVELDPQSSEAYAALGLNELYGRYDWQSSEKYMRRAVEINPNNTVAHSWFTHNLYSQKKFAEGRRHLQTSLELDPLSLQNRNTYVWGLYFERRLPEALAEADDLIERFPASSHPYLVKSAILRFTGRTREALDASVRALEFSQDKLFTYYGHAAALAADGKRDEALNIIENRAPDDYLSDYHIAIVYIWLGEIDKALAALDKAFARREGALIWLAVEPSFDSLRGDARYQKLLERMNHPLAGKADFDLRGFENFQTAEKNKLQEKKEKSKFYTAIKYGLLAVALVAFGFLFYNVATRLKIDTSSVPPEARWKNNFASTMTARRLTTSGKASQAVLSPDGASLAYVLEDNGQRSLWIRSTDSDNRRQLIEYDAVFYTELRFSPDGNYIYYIVSRTPSRTLYRISVNGGAPEKISENVFNLFALSPDGRHIVYESRNSDNNQFSLFIAEFSENAQIKSARTLVVLEMPNYFPGGISFAPDGEKIVYPRTVINDNKEAIHLFVYNLATNTNEQLGEQGFDRLDATGWRKNANEIVISAKESDAATHQLWVVAYPSGEVSRLTNDFADYFGVSLTADATTLATTKMSLTSNIWTSEITESSKNYESKIKQISGGSDRRDGHGGLSWTKDGRLLYTNGAEAERGIALMNHDGTNNQLIPTEALNPRFPMLTSDNRFLVYADKKGRELGIWRFDMTARTSVKVSSRYAVTPAVSPDNRSMVYAMLLNQSSNKMAVFRQPLEGGEEIGLTDETSVRPVVSPDGRFVACNYAGDETNKSWQIAVLPMEANAAPKFIQPYKSAFFVSPQERPLAWSPDGRFLYFLNNAGNIANVFRVAVEGDAAPVQVTHFTSGEIFDFALAPDGKSLAIARGATASDIVVFKNSR